MPILARQAFVRVVGAQRRRPCSQIGSPLCLLAPPLPSTSRCSSDQASSPGRATFPSASSATGRRELANTSGESALDFLLPQGRQRPPPRQFFSPSLSRHDALVPARAYAPSSDDPSVVTSSSAASPSLPVPTTLAEAVALHYRPAQPLTLGALVKTYRSLSKFRLTTLVVLTSMAGYALCPTTLGATGGASVSTLLALTLGTALCSSSANSINELVEAPYDAQMARTRARPLPARLISPLHVASFATVTGLSGVTLLHALVNPLTALLGASNIALYSFAYTPLKRVSISNTWLGSLVGAIPPLMGWTAITSSLDPFTQSGAWALAGLLFAWQFPHFNSLSHNIRSEYAKGGYRMMAVTDPALNRRVSLRYALALLPLCSVVFPLTGVVHGLPFAVLSLLPNGALVWGAWRFYRRKDGGSARTLFFISLVHLPAVLVLAMACKKGLWEGWWAEDEEEAQKEDGRDELGKGQQVRTVDR